MRTRKILVGLALGTTLALGAVAAPAQAAPAASSVDTRGPADARNAAAVKHFYSSHQTIGACYNRGNYWMSQHPSWTASCERFPGHDGVVKWHLYMWY